MNPSLKVDKSPMHRTQLFIPKGLHKALAQEAHTLGITNSELVRQIISQYLSKNSREKTETGMRLLFDMAED